MISSEERTYLNDKSFLFKLSSQKNREIFAKIIALTKDEQPIEELQGKITSGNISIDGASSIRRTCSLGLNIGEAKITNYLWTLNTKFNLEVGLKNTINTKYPSIIWFPQGIFVITSFSASIGTSSSSINISGKDKMCLLNGEVSGIIQDISVNFSSIDEYDSNTGLMETRKLTIREILTNLLINYAHENPENIIIKDLEDYGLELLRYVGDSNFYLYSNPVVDKKLFSSNYVGLGYTKSKLFKTGKTFGDLKDLDGKSFGDIIENLDGKIIRKYTISHYPTTNILEDIDDLDFYYILEENKGNNKKDYYQIKEFSYGDSVGYRITDLTYPGDLVVELGNSITTVLDKIKSMLVNYEYFYNEYGQFVFQKKRSFKNSAWNSLKEIFPNTIEYSDVDYNLSNSNLIQSFSQNPQLSNLKNDFSIWGKRKNLSGTEVPIHIRYAIEHKPLQYHTIKVSNNEIEEKIVPNDTSKQNYLKNRRNKIYYSKISPEGIIKYDWREIIYQMASDYYYYNEALDDFYQRVAAANPTTCLYGKTGYEQYYLDIFSYWRDLYNIEDKNSDNIEVNLQIYNKNSYNTNVWAKGYQKLTDKDSFQSILKQAAAKDGDISILDSIKVYKHNGIQNFFQTVPALKFKKNYIYINNKKYQICDLSSFTIDKINNYFRKKEKGNLVTIYGAESENIKLYIKNNKKYTVLAGNKYKSTQPKNVYYKVNNSYINVLTTLRNLSDQYNLYYKDENNRIIDKYSSYVQENKYYINDGTNSLDHSWWYQKYYNIKNLNNYNLFIESNLENNNGNLKISEHSFMKNLYLSGSKLKTHFFEYDFNIDGNLIDSTKRKNPISYYLGSSIYTKNHWNKNIILDPASLTFWIDFLDCSNQNGLSTIGEMEKFSVPSIGTRPTTINSSDVSNSIFYSSIPSVIFTRLTNKNSIRIEQEKLFTGYNFIYTNSATENVFDISTRKKTLQEVLDENLFKYSYCAESVSISLLPLYYLQPNTKISISDKKTGIDGIYEISKISIPLSYNSLSSITATKYVEQLY